MAKVIAITNQKGGVGKTTTAMNFGVGLRLRGKRVLMIDMDPQCSLSYIMGASDSPPTARELLLDPKMDALTAVQLVQEGHLIASSRELGSLEMELTEDDRAFRLSEALKQLVPYYDYVVIDSPPA
ncbi:MAG: AAA family ATPase, partial [Oscillospiraceae bacterium]|nr:AAA family ATPase [Oscillospiraceae bacterium]